MNDNGIPNTSGTVKMMREWAFYLGILRDVAEQLQAAALGAADAMDGPPSHMAAVSPIRPSADRTPENVATFDSNSGAAGCELILSGSPRRSCMVEAVVIDGPPGAIVKEVRIGSTIVWEGKVNAINPVRFAPAPCQPGASVQVAIQLADRGGAISGIAVGLHDLH